MQAQIGFKGLKGFQNPEQTAQQKQWLIIIKDLIQISLHFWEKAEKDPKKSGEMLQRVKKYQAVVESTPLNPQQSEQISINPSELSQLIFVPKQNVESSVNSISSVQKQLEQFVPVSLLPVEEIKRVLATESLTNNYQECLLFSALHQRFKKMQSIEQKQQQILSYIENNILLSYTTSGQKLMEIECLKLTNTLCSSNRFVNYLGGSLQYVKSLANVVQLRAPAYLKALNNQNEEVEVSGDEERLLQVFGVLQKISFSSTAIFNILKTQLVSDLVLKYLVNFSNLSSHVLTYVLALLLNIILKPAGKEKCSNIEIPTQKPENSSFFSLVIIVWNHISLHHCPSPRSPSSSHSDWHQQEKQEIHLQSLVYSIFYVLLSMESNRKAARIVSFRQMMLKYLNQHDDEYHQRVVASILGVLDHKQHTQNQNEDQSMEEEEVSQYDQAEYIEEHIELIWVGNQLTSLSSPLQLNIDNIIKQFKSRNEKEKKKKQVSVPMYMPNSSTPLTENQNKPMIKGQSKSVVMNKNQKSYNGYNPDKYCWKKLKARQS